MKKLVFYCTCCGNEVLLDEKECSGIYDIVCNDCEEKHAEEMNQQQEDFLRKEEPYLYDLQKIR